MISIVDYGAGNILSIEQALRKFDVRVEVTTDPETVLLSDAVVLPGVGAFGEGMSKLKGRGLDRALCEASAAGTPLLGICLGMQLLFESSTEFGFNQGLGLIPGQVDRLVVGSGTRLPHVGWNSIDKTVHCDEVGSLLGNTHDGEDLYFVHSYCALPSNLSHLLAECNYGGTRFAAVVRNENVYGCQFHPEKSGEAGLSILHNFINLKK